MAVETTVENKSARSWVRWVEPWYLTYALLGTTVAGLVPILLPLTVIQSGSAAQVGFVMGAISLGGLAAPIWGGLADRYRLHRWLLITGLVLTAAGLAGFLLTDQPLAWMSLALLESIGAAGAATVANLFVVEAHPKAEWDERIGWLQTFYGGGQVIGLLVAGLLSQSFLRFGLLAAAGLVALGALIAAFTTHTPPNPAEEKPVLLHPARVGEWTVLSPQRLFHFSSTKTLRQVGSTMRSPFGLFLASWVLTFSGAAVVFSLYPLLMQQVFGLSPTGSSAAFALAAGLGLALYTPAGRWSERWGARRVLQAGLAVRLAAFLSLLGLQWFYFSGRGWFAATAFSLVVLAWSLLSVSSTILVAQLSPVGEGEGLGIYNAASALAGMLGAALGGWIAGQWGYPAALGLSVGGTVFGLLLFIMRRETK
jgi:DHA1 family tetracycline resistance protein-like MFS transporter